MKTFIWYHMTPHGIVQAVLVVHAKSQEEAEAAAGTKLEDDEQWRLSDEKWRRRHLKVLEEGEVWFW